MKSEDSTLLAGGLVLLILAVAMIAGIICIEEFTAYPPRISVAVTWLCLGVLLIVHGWLTR